MDKVNGLSQTLHGKSVFPVYTAPSVYTGELFGVNYLYDQTGLRLDSSEDNLDREIDEGFEDVEEDELTTGSIPVLEEDHEYLSIYPPEESEEEEEEEEAAGAEEEEDEALDAAGIPGWDKVDAIAQSLMRLEGLAVTNTQAEEIKRCYRDLLEYDKRPVRFRPRLQKAPRGRFGRRKGNRSGHTSLEAMKRCFLSAGSPASLSSKSRVVEAICIRLLEKFPKPRRTDASGRRSYTSRWRLVLSE